MHSPRVIIYQRLYRRTSITIEVVLTTPTSLVGVGWAGYASTLIECAAVPSMLNSSTVAPGPSSSTTVLVSLPDWMHSPLTL